MRVGCCDPVNLRHCEMFKDLIVNRMQASALAQIRLLHVGMELIDEQQVLVNGRSS